MLSLNTIVTALLLPACMVTAHAVDHSTLQPSGVAVQASGTLQPVVADALATDISVIDSEPGSFRHLLANKKGEGKKKTTKKTTREVTEFKWKGRGKNGLKFKSNRPRKALKKGEIVYDADGVKCVASKEETNKIAFSQSAELHASAVAEAVEYLCNPPGDFHVEHLEEIFEEAEAAAFAHAAVQAKLKCKSKGKDTPETCVSYSATATAIAEATATAHAEAATEALASCPCMTAAVAAAFASADLYIELIADASVTAEATVCVEGKSKSKSAVWEECTSVIYAKLFARALAHAATFGTCLSPEATASLEVYVGAEITKYNTPQCDVEPVCNGCD